MPTPVSLTWSTASAPRWRVPMVTWPPAGVNLSALVSRLVMIWCSQRSSARTGTGARSWSRRTPAASNRRARLAGRGRRAARQVARAQRQLQGGGIGRGQRLQVVHHPGQPQYLVPERGQLGRGGLGQAVQQCLVPGLQDRHRGAQLVRDVGHQVAAKLLLPVQGAGHLVEGDGQLAQLTRRPDAAGPGRAVTTGHGPGHRDQAGDRPGDPPGHGQPGDQGQQGGQAGRARDRPEQRGLQRPVGRAQPGTGGPDHHLADALRRRR